MVESSISLTVPMDLPVLLRREERGCLVFCVLRLRTLEINDAVGELASLLLRVYALEFDDGGVVVSESVFLEEEGNEDSLGLNDDIVGVGGVEHVIIEHEVHLSFHAVWLADSSYGVNLLWLDHCNGQLSNCK